MKQHRAAFRAIPLEWFCKSFFLHVTLINCLGVNLFPFSRSNYRLFWNYFCWLWVFECHFGHFKYQFIGNIMPFWSMRYQLFAYLVKYCGYRYCIRLKIPKLSRSIALNYCHVLKIYRHMPAKTENFSNEIRKIKIYCKIDQKIV